MCCNLLKQLRSISDITQAQAAEGAGIPLEQYRRIESGAEDPDPELMRSIADLFGVPPRLAFGCAPDELQDDSAARMIALFCSLNSTGRQMLVDYATMLTCKHGYRKKLCKNRQHYPYSPPIRLLSC